MSHSNMATPKSQNLLPVSYGSFTLSIQENNNLQMWRFTVVGFCELCQGLFSVESISSYI